MKFKTLGRKVAAKISTNKISGKDDEISPILIIIESNLPPL